MKKVVAIATIAAAFALPVASANAGGYGGNYGSKAKSFYLAGSVNTVSSNHKVYFTSAGCGCQGEIDAYSYKEHSDYARKTSYGVEAGGRGLAGSFVEWKGAHVAGALSGGVSGTSFAVIGGSSGGHRR